MSTREATEWVKSFELRPREEEAIIRCDVRGESVIKASIEMELSREMISRLKAKGYDRISRDIGNDIPD
jgi:hypothetical protein